MFQTKLKPPVITSFELEKYSGKWYEIARIPNRFEKNLIQVTATYKLLDNGRVQVINAGFDRVKKKWKQAKGKAKFASTNQIGHLKVSFFGPFYADYFVLDTNYQYALVGGNSPGYLWILSRTKKMDREILDNLIQKATIYGYETEEIIFVDQ